MISVRENTFETNSSSTHSLTITSEKEYEAWKKGELLFSCDSEEFVSKSDLYEKCVDAVKADFEDHKYSYEYDKSKKITWALKRYKLLEYMLNHLPTKEDFDTFVEKLQEEDSHHNLSLRDVKSYDANDMLEHPENATMDNLIVGMLRTFENSRLFSEKGYYSWLENQFETFHEEKVIDGVKVIVFGYYGYDG